MKKIFKTILTVTIMLLPEMALASTLETPNFIIKVTSHCEEGVVGCNKVTYKGTHKKTRKTIKLSGKQLMRMCADGVTPCQALGYEFKNGKYVYLITEEGNLKVSHRQKVIVNEIGKWND